MSGKDGGNAKPNVFEAWSLRGSLSVEGSRDQGIHELEPPRRPVRIAAWTVDDQVQALRRRRRAAHPNPQATQSVSPAAAAAGSADRRNHQWSPYDRCMETG